jgi:hypothetical protein
LTTFFAVVVGLLVGVFANNSSNAGAFGALLLLTLIILAVLDFLNLPTLPENIRQALGWLPGAAALKLFRLSMVGEIPSGMLWTNAGALLAAGLAGYFLALWRIRRVDR